MYGCGNGQLAGLGIDICQISRLEAAISKAPRLYKRLFTSRERHKSIASLAARFALKEAVVKALGVPVGWSWQEVELCDFEAWPAKNADSSDFRQAPEAQEIPEARRLQELAGVEQFEKDSKTATEIYFLQGKRQCILRGKIAERFISLGGVQLYFSISHDANYAVAQVGILEKNYECSVNAVESLNFVGELLKSVDQSPSLAGFIPKIWPAEPNALSHKYSRGVIGILAGEDQYPGAGILAAKAAINSGVGMVRRQLSARSPKASELLVMAVPEVILDSECGQRLDALLVGSGITDLNLGTEILAILQARKETYTDIQSSKGDSTVFTSLNYLPLVVDAGGLGLLSKITDEEAVASFLAGHSGPLILTPHVREYQLLAQSLELKFTDLARLQADLDYRVASARALAKQIAKQHAGGCLVVIKGSKSVLADNWGNVRVAPMASSYLSTAGTGDVLAGVLGGMWAQITVNSQFAPGNSWKDAQFVLKAVLNAVTLHSQAAAELGIRPFGASELAAQIPHTLRRLRE